MIGIMTGHPLETPQEVITEYELWEKARQRLYEVYGSEPPTEFILRFESEFACYYRKQWIEHVMMLHQLQEKGLGRVFQGRTIYGFIPWLMGINWINPLPPHTYCPKCKRVVMHTEVRDGWDLRPETCACGETMICDGHNIPLDPDVHGYSDRRNTIEPTIRPQSKQAVLDFIRDYYGTEYQLYPMLHMIEGKAYDINSYAIIPANARIWYPVTTDGAILLPESCDTNDMILSHQRALIVNINDKDDDGIHLIYRYEMSEEEAKEVLQPEILKKRMQAMRHIEATDEIDQLIWNAPYPAMDLPDEVQFPDNFSGFMQQAKLCLNSRLWFSGAEKWIMEDGVDPMEIPYTAQDFMKLLAKYLSYSGFETEWVRILINDIYANAFSEKTNKTFEEWESILTRLNLPSWIKEYIQIVKSLPSKDGLIYSVCQALYNEEHPIE